MIIIIIHILLFCQVIIIRFTIQPMNLLKIDSEIQDFRQRIIKTLKLQQYSDGKISNQKLVCKWIYNEMQKMKKGGQETKGLFSNKMFAGMMQKIIKIEEQPKQTQNDLKNLIQCIRNKYIPKSFQFTSKSVPTDIITAVNYLKERKWQDYYGEAKGPFLNNMFIMKKQDFHLNVEQIKINGLKFMMIEEKVAHKYQRNLIQEIFGRVFRSRGSLSMVIKIQVNHDALEMPYNIFCYIEDRKLIDEDYIWRPLDCLKKNDHKLEIESNGKILEINELNFLQIFLAQILVVPVQSLVSDFIVRITSHDEHEQVQIAKCNQQDQQDIVKETNLREHPSLRNPLLYFSDYLRKHPIKINQAKNVAVSRQLYSSFFRSLEIVIKLILTDFETNVDQIKINSSLCFNLEVFSALWNIFHRISLLTRWMVQVIQPVKNTITISEIISHFCPIFNQISAASRETDSYSVCRQFYKNVEMQSYLGSVVSKKSLQKYLDIFVNEGQAAKGKKYENYQQIYNYIFKPIIQNANLKYLEPIQSSYILYFVCKYKYECRPQPADVYPNWKQPEIWQKCIKCLIKQANSKNGELSFIDVGFDILGYICGINVHQIDNNCFEKMKYFQETQASLLGIDSFVKFIREKYEKTSEAILSSLLQKSFKHKKFQTCKKLLEKNIRIRNFHEIISFNEIVVEMDEQARENLVKTIQQDSPQMHRLFKWQELVLVHLKKQAEKTIPVETFDFGICYIPQQILKSHIKNGKVINNLSRKDYRFDSNRDIAYVTHKINNGKTVSFYLQNSQFPVIGYFYRSFFTKIGIPQIMPYFTTFFYENRLFHIVQCLQQSLNYRKGLTNFKEEQLAALTDETLISEAILLSMIVLPSKIQTKDLIVCPTKATHDQIFLVDWYSNFCKNYMNKYLGKTILNSKNSLLLMEKMTKLIDKKIINKYAGIQIQKISEEVLQQCKTINTKINQLKEKYCKDETPLPGTQRQLSAIMFEQGFIFKLVERVNKMKRAFNKKQSNQEKGLSFFRLLELIDSETSYFYLQVFNSKQNLLDREKILFDENWKRSFLQTSIVQFFGSFARLEEIDNIFPLHYERFCFQGPTQNLVHFATNIKKLAAFNIASLPDNLNQYDNEVFEYFMKNCDTTNLDAASKQKFIEMIKNKSKQYLNSQQKRVLPLSYICLKSAEFVKDKSIVNCFSFERVQQLDIQYCKLGEYQLNQMPKIIQNVLYLNLSNITGLKYIGQNVLYGKTIEIKHLKTLSIVQCNDLIMIDLKCDILENLELRNNKSLQSVYIYSLNMKNIYIYNNPSLNFQNIAMYIIKGINVLVCRLSCHGDLMKLYADQYEAYLAHIVKYLLLRFYQSTDSRYCTLLTLVKMKELDENLFTLAGISNFKAITSMFNKFTNDTEDKILIEILRIYFSNPYRKRIAVSDLTQAVNSKDLNIQRLIKLTNEALLKVNNVAKHINEIKLQNSKQFFSQTNSNNIKIMVDRIKLDKNITVIFENLNEQMEGEDGETKETIGREIDSIRYLALEKPQLQKITLVFRRSIIKFSYLDRIFRDTVSLQDIKRQEQEQGLANIRTKSGLAISYRQTLKDQNQKYMKIVNITLEGCTLKNDRLGSNKQIKQSQQQKKKSQKEQSKKGIQIVGEYDKQKSQEQQISIESIVSNNHYTSVKYLKLEGCNLISLEILSCMPNLSALSIYKCKIKSSAESSKQIKKQEYPDTYRKIFQSIAQLDLHILDLQNFFTSANTSIQDADIFNEFCLLLVKMQKLKTLKLNKNEFSLENLKKLDQILNETTIQQLQLTAITLPIVDKSPLLRVQIQQRYFDPTFSNLFSNTQNLKSLSIQLNSHDALQSFIESVSKNTSLIELKLYTNCQVSSLILKPLTKNTTLSLISSNMQLPVWLLNHVMGNAQNMRKTLNKKQSIADETLDRVDNDANMSLGSLTNIKSTEYYRVGLSLDGGGVRGMLLATQLNYLASRVGYPLHKIFDCIGGTSIGGILALASAGALDGENPVANTQQLMILFSKYGKDIFKKSQYMQIKSLFDTKYSAASFEGVLKNYFKDCKLSNCLPDTNVIVTAVNRVDNKDYIFRSMEALLNRDKDFYLRDVARATSAAPTYFPSAQIKNVNASIKLSLIDGGVGLNNPSKLVIDEVKKISANSGSSENYFLLSLGTGKLPNEVIPEYAGLKDLSPIIDSFTQSAANFVERDLASNYKGHFFRVSPLINVAVKKDAQLDNTSQPIIEMYKQTGLESAKKNFENTVIFGKYRNMNLIQWLRENTERKYQF